MVRVPLRTGVGDGEPQATIEGHRGRHVGDDEIELVQNRFATLVGHAWTGATSSRDVRIIVLSSAESACPCLATAWATAASTTSSSVPAMVSVQLMSLGTLPQSIIFRAMRTPF